MAKLENAKQVSLDALQLLAQTHTLRATDESPAVRAFLQWEAELGGRDAAAQWVSSKVAAMQPDLQKAFRWALFDQRRALLLDLQVVVQALEAVHSQAEQTATTESRRHDSIRRGRREGQDVTSDEYIAVCRKILDQGVDKMHRAEAFRRAVKSRGWPEVAERTRRGYFAKARQAAE